MHWKTSRRILSLERPLVMGILNVTPDSFSDGGRFMSVDEAIKHVAAMIGEGADIIDIGGESTRPGSCRVSIQEEIERVVPLIEKIVARFDIPISIDTSKAAVAETALKAGAEIVNDISGLRWEPELANVVAKHRAGSVLMHSRGQFETMHSQPQMEDALADVVEGLKWSVNAAKDADIEDDTIALDIGIGFGKTPEQNLELVAKLDRLVNEFESFPLLVGASRKSFIGKMLGGVEAADRLSGSLAVAVLAVWNGANVIRAHDIKETVDVLRMTAAISSER